MKRVLLISLFVLSTSLSWSAGTVTHQSLLLDEDDMVSDSVNKAASQQSVKAYVDSGTVTMTNKSLTAAKITTASSLNDANGNELIKVPAAVAAAVNEITVTNAATGGAPGLSATGGDSSMDFTIVAKGSGNVSISGIKYPNADGSAGQIMETDGAGLLSFVDSGKIKQIVFASQSTAVSDSSAADVTANLSKSITISAGSTVLIFVQGSGRIFKASADDIIEGDFKIWRGSVGGTLIAAQEFYSQRSTGTANHGAGGPISFSQDDSPGAGAHTYFLGMDSGSGVTITAHQGNRRSVMALVEIGS